MFNIKDATASSPAGKTYSYDSVLAGDKYHVEAISTKYLCDKLH